MSPIAIETMPPRANSLIHKLPDMDELADALGKIDKHQIVVFSDRLDSEGTARNLTRHAVDKLAQRDPAIKARGHVVPKTDENGDYFLAAVSNAPAKDATTKTDTPAATKPAADKPAK